jgi:hypothetical protein
MFRYVVRAYVEERNREVLACQKVTQCVYVDPRYINNFSSQPSIW